LSYSQQMLVNILKCLLYRKSINILMKLKDTHAICFSWFLKYLELWFHDLGLFIVNTWMGIILFALMGQEIFELFDFTLICVWRVFLAQLCVYMLSSRCYNCSTSFLTFWNNLYPQGAIWQVILTVEHFKFGEETN